MSEKKNDVQPVEIDQAMGVAADEIDPGMSVMPEGPGPMDVPTIIPELDSMLAAMSSALPAYQTTAWKNKPSTETPIDAAAMTRIEQRLVDLTNAVNALRDSVSQLPISTFNTKNSAGDVTVTFSRNSRAVALIIADGNGLGSSMTYVSGLSKLVKAIVGDCSATWNGDGTILTIKSTNWNNITIISADQFSLSMA